MYTAKQMIVMRRDLKMRKGKIAAQAGHAWVEAILTALHRENRLSQICFDGGHITIKDDGKPDTPLSQWFKNGEAKICVYVDSEAELLEIDRKARESGIISSLICDGGLTEFHGQSTYTCLAFEPQLPEKVDPITGGLPLF